MGGDINTDFITEAITKTVTITLPQGVIQGREDHEGLTGGDLQLCVHPVGVRDKQNLCAILKCDK